MPRWWVQTAGNAVDYAFLGPNGQPERWWSPYLRYSAPEDRMMVVETGPEGFRAYCTAMDAGRKDGASPRRDIRTSVIVEGAPSEAGLLGKVLLGWFGGTLGAALRRILTTEVVDGSLPGRKLPSEVVSALEAALAGGETADVALASFGVRVEGPSSAVDVQRRCAATAVSAAAAGHQGVLCLLNLLPSPSDVFQLAEARAATVLVVVVEDATSGPLVEPGAPNPLTAGRHGTSTGRNERQNTSCAVMILGVTLLLAVLALALYAKR